MGRICDKWHRYCASCGHKSHVNATRSSNYESKPCPECGGEHWTRDRRNVYTAGGA